MYIEISTRQSGKSTRLVEDMKDYLRNNPYAKVIFITPYKMLTQILIKSSDVLYLNRDRIITEHRSNMSLDGYRGIKIFVDEFDYCKDKVQSEIYKYITEKGNDFYITGSLKYVRERGVSVLEDYLYQLIVYNQYRYVSHNSLKPFVEEAETLSDRIKSDYSTNFFNLINDTSRKNTEGYIYDNKLGN